MFFDIGARPVLQALFPALTLIIPVALASRPPVAAAATPCVTGYGCETWSDSYNGPNNWMDNAQALAPSPDGGTVYVTGFASWPIGGWDYTTLAYDAITGSVLWVAHEDGGTLGNDFARDVVASRDGSLVFVGGFSSTTVEFGYQDALVVAYQASSGTTVWTAGQEPGPARAERLLLHPDQETLFVGGTSGNNFLLNARNPTTGTEIWSSSHDFGQSEEAVDMALAPDGSRIYLAGKRTIAGSDPLAFAAGYSAETGQPLWGTTIDASSEATHAEAVGVVASPDGSRVFLTGFLGEKFPGGLGDYWTAAVDAVTGTVLWIAIYAGDGGGDESRGVAVSPWGDLVYVTGTSYGADSSWDGVTVAYDAITGAEVWANRYVGLQSWQWLNAVTVPAGGHRVYATGLGSSGQGAYMVTLCLDAATGTTISDRWWRLLNDTLEIGQDEGVAPPCQCD